LRSLFLPLLPRIAAGSLRVWIFVGVLLRLTTLRDHFQPLALVYYTTPFPVMVAGFLVLVVHEWRGRHEHAARRNVILMAGACYFWVHSSWQNKGEAPHPENLRCVEWNVARPTPSSRLSHIAKWLHAQDPDVIALAEAIDLHTPDLAPWQHEFPGYVLVPLPAEMLCLVRGELVSAETGDLAPGSGYGLLKVRVRGHSLTLLQADIDAAPLKSRAAPLARLTEIADAHAAEPLLVWGDFNTPRESAHLDGLRAHFQHAFESAGAGIAETWPMPLPALSLDNVWTSASLRATRCRIGYQPWSDHRPVVTEVAVGKP
jgi:endonuclease/exonuclease/phosphatase (EEP) superfamily protein YafD